MKTKRSKDPGKGLSFYRILFMILIFLLLGFQQLFAQFKVIGYVPSWGGNLNDVQYSKLTHINYAFLIPTSNGGYEAPDATRLRNLVSLAHAQGTKVIISVGGGGGGNAFKTICPSASLRTTFVNNMMSFVNQYNLDGVDIDWEFPSSGTEANNFSLLMQELYAKMHANGKLCTIAVIAYGGTSIINSVFNAVDFINIMAYDENSYDHSTYDLAVKSVNYWEGRGLPKDKTVLGVPFYGRDRCCDYKTVGYNEILAGGGSPNADTWNNQVGYNGIPTMKKKTAYAMQACGGIMIWSLDTDVKGANSLLSAINEVVGTNGNPVPDNLAKGKTVTVSSTEVNSTISTAGSNATDGNYSTRWSSLFADPQWLSVDLGASYDINRVKISWESAYAKDYQIQISTNGTDWNNLKSVTGNTSTTNDQTGLSGNGRYVRIYGTSRATTYGYSILELEVYGTAPVKQYTINKTNSLIAVDGVLDEASWTNAPFTESLINMNGTNATQTTKAKMLWSDTHLYMAFTVQDNSIWSTLTARDAQLWTQDVFEVLIDKDGDGVNYSELGFSPNGNFYDFLMDKPYSAGGVANTGWNINGLTAKSTVTGTINTATGGVQWVVEVALPFAGVPTTPAAFGKPNAGDVWRLNLARADHNYNDANSEKLYTWNYTDGVSNHVPSKFGKVTFGNGPSNIAPTVSLTSPVSGTIFTAPASVVINADASDEDGTVSKVDFYNGTTLIGTDATTPYSITWSSVAAGAYNITAKATDNAGAVTTSSTVSITVKAPVVCQPASASADDGNVAANVLDNNLATRWSASGDGQWIQFCLDSVKSVSGVQISFYNGTARQSIFDVQLSIDGNSFVNALTNVHSSGTSTNLENFTFASQNAKYVRILGHGNNLNTWNSYTEVKVLTGAPPANQAPSASITSPANNASFNAPASIVITANASDIDGTVSKVEFFNDSILLGTDVSAPYSFTWNNVAIGTYKLKVKATDNLDSSFTSSSITVVVKEAPANVFPTVSLTSPANNAAFNAPASISIAANAGDQDGSVTKVDFYNGSTLLGTDAVAPYSFTWSNVAAGTYTITAKATDNAGASTTSAAVSVKVNAVTNICASTPQYVENGGYAAGSKVQSGGKQYQCKPYPYSGWCNGSAWAYAPGTGSYWADAWTLVGNCSARTANDIEAIPTTLNNYPNPFINVTSVEVTVEQAGDVNVKVYDKTGKEVATLANGYFTAGTYNFSFDASNLSDDIYLIKFNTNDNVTTHKIVKTH